MRICYIADARSAIAQNWIQHFIRQGHDVHVISSYPCPTDILPGASVYPTPMRFSGLSRVSHDGTVKEGKNRRVLSFLAPIIAILRTGALSSLTRYVLIRILAPFEILRHVEPIRQLINEIDPDIVHAMRIPFEGIVAAKATPQQFPLLISVWGNDFTLVAMRNILVGIQTRQVIKRTDALHADCYRDVQIAKDWGLDPDKPTTVLPGAGGLQLDQFCLGGSSNALRESLDIPADSPVIINPRGYRGYVRNDVYFRAIPLILEKHPEAVFLSIGFDGVPIAQRWVKQLDIAENVRLLPYVPRSQIADLFRLSQIMVSPSLHDGTPNSLLESLACGCFPVAGNIESIREWITDESNGLLCNPKKEESIARAITRALEDEQLREQAQEYNQRLIAERAEYGAVMAEAEEFYTSVINSKQSALP
jgi:glycosyltransferase involved in cell wall biosynthesis